MNSRGFVLLEAILAVGIFAIGVLALGRCVNNCIAAEHFKREDALAGQALENRMAEIEAGAVVPESSGAEILESPFDGMKLKQTVLPLQIKNEKDQDLAGLLSVALSVAWTSSGASRERSLTFYVLPRQQ
jgi:type II secretion system protein I